MDDPTHDRTRGSAKPRALSDKDLDHVQGGGMFGEIGRALGLVLKGGISAAGGFAGKAVGGIFGTAGGVGGGRDGASSGDGLTGGGGQSGKDKS